MGKLRLEYKAVPLIIILLVVIVVLGFMYIRRIQPRDNYYYLCNGNTEQINNSKPVPKDATTYICETG